MNERATVAARWAAVGAALAAAVVCPAGTLSAQPADGAYARGVEILETRKDWRAALDAWAAAPDELLATGGSDPRIGVAFIETALANDAHDRLEEASTLYLWGFSGNDMAERRDAVVEEAHRILPILEPRDSVRWSHIIEGEDAEELALTIARFWLERDPTPETTLNERLVEHWSRIVEARRIYRYNRQSVYETDDRGVIFVKYGPPDTRTAGHLGSNEMELKIRIPQDAAAREALRRLDPSPQFELWKYGGLNAEDFTYYLFGNWRGTGPFQLVESPVDLISDAARSMSTQATTPGGVRALHYFELFYYRDLAVLGGRFGSRFDELSALWDGYTERRNAYGFIGVRSAPAEPTLEAFSYRFAEEDRYAPPGAAEVPVRSDWEGEARSVEMVVQAVRVLEADQPMIVVQALSAPRLRFEGRGRRDGAYRAPLRDTEHTLIVRNRELEEAGRLTKPAPAAAGGVSVYHLRHPPQPIHITVVGSPLGQPSVEADTLRLPGQAHAYVERPLSPDPSSLELSDVAVGIPIDVTATGDLLPFPLLPSPRIWTGDALRVYLELYHLVEGADGVARYRLDFKVLPLDRTGEVRASPDQVTLGIELESDSPVAKRHFDIGLTGLKPGFYRLQVEAADLVSRQSQSRTADIEIIG